VNGAVPVALSDAAAVLGVPLVHHALAAGAQPARQPVVAELARVAGEERRGGHVKIIHEPPGAANGRTRP
jgi:hypothetical protein